MRAGKASILVGLALESGLDFIAKLDELPTSISLKSISRFATTLSRWLDNGRPNKERSAAA
jgi:hypothetical protein